MQFTTRAAARALIVTSLALGVAACGNDDADRPGGAPAATSPSTGSGDNGEGRGVGVNAADGAYVRQMIPHDAQIVVMAVRAPKASKNDELKALASQIRENTTEELRALQQFATARRYDLSKPDVRKDEDAEALHTTADKLGTPVTPNPSDEHFDEALVDLLIEHHEGSLVMSRAVRKHGVDETLADLARKQVKQLNDELDQLRALAERL